MVIVDTHHVSYLEACKIAGVTPKYERPKNKKPNDSERDKIKEVRKAVRDAEIAKTIFDERRPIVGTIAQTFLHEHRKLETALLPMLASRRDVAFHPAVKFVAEGNCKLFSKIAPAIIGVITDPLTGRPTGQITRTSLDQRTGRKLAAARTLLSRTKLELLGAETAVGGIIRLGLDSDIAKTGVLCIAEGLEFSPGCANAPVGPNVGVWVL